MLLHSFEKPRNLQIQCLVYFTMGEVMLFVDLTRGVNSATAVKDDACST
jgi:hypothetical protein